MKFFRMVLVKMCLLIATFSCLPMQQPDSRTLQNRLVIYNLSGRSCELEAHRPIKNYADHVLRDKQKFQSGSTVTLKWGFNSYRVTFNGHYPYVVENGRYVQKNSIDAGSYLLTINENDGFCRYILSSSNS